MSDVFAVQLLITFFAALAATALVFLHLGANVRRLYFTLLAETLVFMITAVVVFVLI